VIVGVPKEIKANEGRVSLLPVGAEELTKRGHEVLVEAGAGAASGFPDDLYLAAGAKTVRAAEEVWGRSGMVVKVKEPVPDEYGFLREDLVVFTFFHFAASRELTEAVSRSKCGAIAYETIETSGGRLPLLVPMSEVAGRMAVQEAAKYLERAKGGRGILLSGVPGVEPATVLVLGAARRARMPQGSRPVSAPRSMSWTSTWTACAASTTSCRPTLPRSCPTLTTYATFCRWPTSSSARCSFPEAGRRNLSRRRCSS